MEKCVARLKGPSRCFLTLSVSCVTREIEISRSSVPIWDRFRPPRALGLINNSRNSFQNKMGGQKSAFFEISIEIKSAQPVSCSQVSSFDTAGTAVLISPPLGPRATCRGAVIGIHWGGTRGSRSGGGAWGRNRRWKVRELRGARRGHINRLADAILGWWRDNSSTFPAWALGARIVFAVSPNSASCERVFALLKNLFGEEQMSAPCRLRASFADTELQRPRGGLRYVLAAAACTCQGFVFGSHMPEVGGVCSLGGGRVGPWGEEVRRVPKG